MRGLLALLLLVPLLARAQTVTSTVTRPVLLFQSVALVGNGADTTEDTLYTAPIAASQLANVGDTFHVVARGLTAASTDVKSIRVKLGASNVCTFNSSAVGNTTYMIELWIVKTGANAQSTVCFSTNATNAVANALTVTAVTDTAASSISVTGQNNTTSTLNSIQAQLIMVWYLPGV
jgi:hypothetical protein